MPRTDLVSFRFSVAASLAALVLLLTSSLASAHEHRDVGDYTVTVGFLNEPALVDEPNGLYLRIEHGHEDEGEAVTPVEGLASALKADVRFGSETRELTLRAAFGDPGLYVSDFIPTAEGAYTFRITGTIEDTPIDEEFTSGPETFSEVEGKDTMNFPAVGGDTDNAVSDAQDTADSARTLAIAGIIVGVLGLAAGIAGLMAAMNARSTRSGEARTTGDATR